MLTAEETHLTWAVRSWDAEVENARRLATRVNVVLTVALAAAAAASKVLGDTLLPDPRSGRAFLLGMALLLAAVAGVICIFVAFVRVLIKPQPPKRPTSASAHLLPPEDVADFDQATAGLDKRALQRAFLSTTAAAYELHARNAEERKRLAAAQQWLIVGAALTLLCGAIYTWIRPLPHTEASVSDGGSHGERRRPHDRDAGGNSDSRGSSPEDQGSPDSGR